MVCMYINVYIYIYIYMIMYNHVYSSFWEGTKNLSILKVGKCTESSLFILISLMFKSIPS